MNFFDLVNTIFTFFLDFINSIYFILFLSIIILIYVLIAYYFKDRKKIKKINSYQDNYNPTLKELKALPLINIIVPAWKENEIFRGCLKSITKLSYPNLKIIVNAGGNEDTISIANYFKKYANFVILQQEKGGGKIKAINDSLAHVSEGFVYLIDADIYLNDNIFIKMLHAVINENKNVVISLLKPHNSQKNNDLVKYIFINRYAKNKKLVERYADKITPHTCLKYEVIKSIKKFPEKQLFGDDAVIGVKIVDKGYKIYRIHQFIESFNYPGKLKEYVAQNMRWVENNLMTLYKKDKKKLIIKFFYLLASIYLIIFPFLIFFNFGFFMIGLLILLAFYLNKIRYIIYFKKTFKENNYTKIHFIFFFKIIYLIYLDIFIFILTLFELIFFKKKYRERKNIEK